MGYMRHHAIIVTSYSHRLREAHSKALEIFPAEMVSPFMPPQINDYASFFIQPDGSKEGWPESNSGDDMRSAFVDYLKTFRYSDGSPALAWVEVQYGDDDLDTKIVHDSDEERRLKRGEDRG